MQYFNLFLYLKLYYWGNKQFNVQRLKFKVELFICENQFRNLEVL